MQFKIKDLLLVGAVSIISLNLDLPCSMTWHFGKDFVGIPNGNKQPLTAPSLGLTMSYSGPTRRFGIAGDSPLFAQEFGC